MMRNGRKRLAWIGLFAIVWVALDLYSFWLPNRAEAALPTISPAITEAADSSTYIIKWKGSPDPTFAAKSIIEREYGLSGMVVARPGAGVNSAEWLAEWENSPGVQYIVPNRKVGISAAASNDPFIDKQTYLQRTHTTDVWQEVSGTETESVVIAIVDTGVDLSHVDLKGNLVPGVNLIQPNIPPRDDNGHGTNVAGVIAAVVNNSKGVAGMLWKASIMPIKALEPSGRGDEDKLGEGIRYAVDNGAKIVVLSVGLLRNDAYLQEIVQYAEDHNVMLIAATGNDEGRNVRYPAAYPTVLAVGGVGENNAIEERSNYGPELDLVAPWSVFTTAIGNKYEYQDGTSMAAPQVAAAAAMVWAKYPYMKAHQVRSLLRQTADDIGEAGWDERTGYGLLRVDRAWNEPLLPDMYEPNNSRAEAKPYTAGRMISAELSGGADVDWFYIDVPYDGTLHMMLLSDAPVPSDVKLTHVGSAGVYAYKAVPGKFVQLKVAQGINRIALQFENSSEPMLWPYRLTSHFSIYRDSFEDNDRQYQAFKLAPRSQSVKGTFDKEGDEDWFSMTFEQSGNVTVTLTPDTKRMDPVLMVQKKSERGVTIDDNDDGEFESHSFQAFPGTYYFKAGKVTPEATIGEYTLEIVYEPKYMDPNEPNDRPYQATVLHTDTEYEGVFDRSTDIDYFKFTIAERSLVDFSMTDIPVGRQVTAVLQTNALSPVVSQTSDRATGKLAMSIPLNAGTYYVRMTPDEAFQEQLYRLRLHTDILVGGFTDITGHWAKDAIVELSAAKIIEGYGNYTFRPEASISRAEAVTLLVKAFEYSKKRPVTFPDLPESHWAYDSVSKALQADVVQGYPDGRFDPDGKLSRVEMASLFSKALRLGGKLRGDVPFTDIGHDFWALPILKQMKAEGWLTGYDDGTFRPDMSTTRAEFTVMLQRIMNR